MTTKSCMSREYDLDSLIVEVDVIYEATWYEGEDFEYHQGHFEVNIIEVRFRQSYWYVGGILCERFRSEMHLMDVEALDRLIVEAYAKDDSIYKDCLQHVSDSKRADLDMMEYHSRNHFEDCERDEDR